MDITTLIIDDMDVTVGLYDSTIELFSSLEDDEEDSFDRKWYFFSLYYLEKNHEELTYNQVLWI